MKMIIERDKQERVGGEVGMLELGRFYRTTEDIQVHSRMGSMPFRLDKESVVRPMDIDRAGNYLFFIYGEDTGTILEEKVFIASNWHNRLALVA